MYENNIHSQTSILGTWSDEQVFLILTLCMVILIWKVLMMKVML